MAQGRQYLTASLDYLHGIKDNLSSMANRVEQELQRWHEKELRLQKIFSSELSTNKVLQREKLREYDRIVAKYNYSNDPDERSSLRMLKGERKHIERLAFPMLAVRWIKKVFVNPILRFVLSRQQHRLADANRSNIAAQLRKIGLGEHFSEVEKRIMNGERDFTTDISVLRNNEKIDHVLSFSQNSKDLYQLVSHQVRVYNGQETKPKQEHAFTHENGTKITIEEKYNLLAGRAIEKDGKWLMLDLNDRDASGNFRMMQVSTADSYSIGKSLKELPFTEVSDPGKFEMISNKLRQGERVEVTCRKTKYFVEAEPRFSSVKVFDCNSQLVSKVQLDGKRTPRKQTVEKSSTQKSAKTTGMRIA